VVVAVATLILDPSAARSDSGYRTFRVPSASMAPTIQIGDYVVVETIPAGHAAVRPCEIVLYRTPPPAGTPELKYFRRVIALPGDRVSYVGGRLRLNGEIVSRVPVGSGDHVTIYRETLPNGCSYLIQEMDDDRSFDNTAETVVPPGTFYGLGDNRDDAMDSRVPTVGPIPIDNVLGRALTISWAKDPSRIGATLSPSSSNTSP
jgi:signal peptidase I